MKILAALFLIVFSYQTYSETKPERLKVLVRIEQKNGDLRIFRSATGDLIPGAFQNKELEKQMTSLEPGEEALIEGHINYRTQISPEKTSYKPYFVIEAVHPVSLKRLGAIDYTAPESSFQFAPLQTDFRPATLPISTEVASALTMTTTLLLMESLSASGSEPSGQRDLQRGLIISAGSMATILFIYEQMKGKKSNE